MIHRLIEEIALSPRKLILFKVHHRNRSNLINTVRAQMYNKHHQREREILKVDKSGLMKNTRLSNRLMRKLCWFDSSNQNYQMLKEKHTRKSIVWNFKLRCSNNLVIDFNQSFKIQEKYLPTKNQNTKQQESKSIN